MTGKNLKASIVIQDKDNEDSPQENKEILIFQSDLEGFIEDLLWFESGREVDTLVSVIGLSVTSDNTLDIPSTEKEENALPRPSEEL